MKVKARTRKRIVKIASIVIVAGVLIGLAVFLALHFSASGWRDFQSVDEWKAWLDGHPPVYAAGAYDSYAEYLQVSALGEGYLVSQQIIFLDKGGGEKLAHIGLLVSISNDYFYSEITDAGRWETIRLVGRE